MLLYEADNMPLITVFPLATPDPATPPLQLISTLPVAFPSAIEKAEPVEFFAPINTLPEITHPIAPSTIEVSKSTGI